MGLSINTNKQALTALSFLKNTAAALFKTSARISTGLKVAGARDDAAIFAVAQKLRGDVAGLGAIQASISRGIGTLDVAMAASEAIADLLIIVREKALSYKAAAGDAERTAILADYNALITQISNLVDGAKFDGQNVIADRQPVTFSHRSSTAPATLGRATVGDFNNDGIEDFVSDNILSLGNGDGTFTISAGPGTVTSTDTADVNNDGNLDIIGASGTVLLGDGTGSFNTSVATSANASTDGPAGFGDFDGDGKIDVLVYEFPGKSFGIYQGDGAGGFTNLNTFVQSAALGGGGQVTQIEVRDLNGDGLDDFIATGSTGVTSVMSIYISNGDGTFNLTSEITLSSQREVTSINVADMDGDGIQDIVLGHEGSASTKETLYYHKGDGNGLFSTSTLVEMNIGDSAFRNLPNEVIGDFNSDGIQDIAYADDTLLKVMYGNGDGSFGSAQILATASSYIKNLQVIDVDGDGFDDVIYNADNTNLETQIQVVPAGLQVLLSEKNIGKLINGLKQKKNLFDLVPDFSIEEIFLQDYDGAPRDFFDVAFFYFQ